VVFLVIAVPWHILAGIRNERFFWFYFVNEHFMRFLGKRYPADYNRLPTALYWTLHLAWLFPWSLYLPAVVRNYVSSRNSEWRMKTELGSFAARTRLLCWIWAGVILLFFSFSTNQEYYTFPAYFPLLLLLADGVARCEQRENEQTWLTACAALIAAISIAAAAALGVGLWSSRNMPFMPDIGAVLAKHDMAHDTLSMSHMLDLSGESFAALRLPAILAAIALIVAPLISLAMRIRKRHHAATWVLAGGMAVVLFAAHIALGRFGPYLSSKPLAQEIAARATSGDKVAIYGDQAFGSSLLFYLRRPIELVNGRTTSMWFGSTYPDAPKIFLNDSDLLEQWSGGGRVFLFVPGYQRSKVDEILPNRYTIAEISGKVVYSNRP
jgi:hypothetical protein